MRIYVKRKIVIFTVLITFILFSFAALLAQENGNIREKVEEILTRYRTIGDPEKSDLLAELGDSVVPVLIEKLENRFSWIVVEALGKIGDRRATPILLKRLTIAENRAQKKAIIRSLGMIGDSIAESLLLSIFEKMQTQGDIEQVFVASSLLKVGGAESKQKVKEMTAYVRDLYERVMWTFDEEAWKEIFKELRDSPFYNEEIVYAFLAALIIDLKDSDLITEAIKYRQLVDESGSRFTDGFKVLMETGAPEAIETIFKFAENNQEMWPPAPPEATEEQRMRYFSVHPIIRISAVETLLYVGGVDINRVTRAFENITVEGLTEIPLTIKFQPDKWNFQWKKTKGEDGEDDEDNDDDEGEGKLNCYLGNIPGGYSARDILAETILLNRKVSPSQKGKKGKIHAKIKRHRKGFIGEVLEVKFNKFEAIKSIESIWPGKECDITITGRLSDNKPFRGSYRIKISKPEEDNDDED